MEPSAIPGAIIPISDESGPLLMATPNPPQAGAWRSSPSIPIANSPTDLVAELEAATSRVVELVRRLDQARTRDEIIDLLIAHLLDSHARAGFFVVRPKLLTTFRIDGIAAGAAPQKPEMKLDGPSTMADVVGTHLPYRGPVTDEASRALLTAALGEPPADVLLVPVSVRDRVVGILFADRRKRHTFDEQLAVAIRAAGVAFERVLLARRER
jgi:transcriptional regulator with GAF, ATPase, and Fis domain